MCCSAHISMCACQRSIDLTHISVHVLLVCRPYIKKVIDSVKQTHPDLPIILYISGSGGLLERMAAANPDIISIDQSVDIVDGIKRVGSGFAIQVGACGGFCAARVLLEHSRCCEAPAEGFFLVMCQTGMPLPTCCL